MQGLRRSLFFITLPLVTLGCLASIDTAKGQITPDNSLGAERSVVNSNTNTDRIDGGARRGANLFHSFQEFNVGERRAALFFNPAGIENILSRVTGGRPSNILGTLGLADGNANLFFINPNGIFFGPNARLDMRGSFLASTANSLLFDGGLEFSVSNPQAPPTLAINIPIGLQFRENSGSITNQSGGVGLQVASGKTLSLVGGDISLDGGRLTASGGQVELGGLAKPGTVSLKSDGSLSFPDGVARGNVALTNGAQVDVTAGGGGSVNIYAQNLDILGNSAVCAGIGATKTCGKRASNFGSFESKAGDVTLNALGILTIQGSQVENDVNPKAIGQGGNINITTGILSLRNGTQLTASTFGKGNAGNVRVSAKDAVSLVNANIFSAVQAGGVGKGGNIDINAATLSLIDGAQLTASTNEASATQPAGRGNAGNVNVNVTGAVDIAGEKNGLFSAIFSRVETGTVGNGGNITINSGSFSLRNGAQLTASTFGKGNAGNVRVSAKDAVSLVNANIFSTVGAGGVGKGGNIDINAATLSLIDSAQLIASTSEASTTQPAGRGNAGNVNVNVTGAVDIAGEKNGLFSAIFSRVETGTVGNGGNITINSGSFSLRDDAVLNAPTFGQGNAGNVRVSAKGAVSLAYAGIVSTVGAGGVGQGGNIDINAATLSLIDGAQLAASTSGQGNAGNVKVSAKDAVSLADNASIFSTVEAGGVGKGGNIDINAATLSLIDGAQLLTLTRQASDTQPAGRGDAGNVRVRAKDAVSLANAGIFSTVEAGGVGEGGNIDINAATLSLIGGAQLNATSSGNGAAGNITATTIKDIRLDSKALISADTKGGQGNITLNSRDLILRDNSKITTNARGSASGGKITIKTENLVAVPKENSDITANAEENLGGRVEINAQGIFGTQYRKRPTLNSDITASSELGPKFSGEVKLNLPNVDPSHGLVELPKNVVDPTEQIAQNPCQRGVGSKFIITGRGGLPPSPNEATSGDAVRVDLVEPASGESGGAGEQGSRGEEKTKSSVSKPIVPAQGWIFDKNGEVMLTAYDPTGTGSQRPLNSEACSVP